MPNVSQIIIGEAEIILRVISKGKLWAIQFPYLLEQQHPIALSVMTEMFYSQATQYSSHQKCGY